MTIIAIPGPEQSDSHQAAVVYSPTAQFLCFNRISEALQAFLQGDAEYAIVPVYNTRDGEVKEYFRLMARLSDCYWIDNVVLPIHLSLAALKPLDECPSIDNIIGRSSVFRQCEEYLEHHFPDATLTAVRDIETALQNIRVNRQYNYAVIETEELIRRHKLELLDREVASHNKTRFAVIGRKSAAATGYDATSIITRPLKDRVGMLADILGEFTDRGINILDLQSENDVKTQKLRIYLEVEGHGQNALMLEALNKIETSVIGEDGSLKVLGSYPRVDMRVKQISSFGFIGSGDMTRWFAERLENEGYETIVTGRSTPVTPEQMIPMVDVVVCCVPISVTTETIGKYGRLMRDGQALIILAGESESTLKKALEATRPGVEVMFVHNLWGPMAVSMKDKNATVVRTHRSGNFCSEFEAFLYKHGADIHYDEAKKHDLLMGVGQKLPTTISVAFAMTLKEHSINYEDIDSHSTLTSLYGILALARIHNQNPRTYAEIMASHGEGRKIVRSFAENILKLIDLADHGKIPQISELMVQNRSVMPSSFLDSRMKLAKAVDDLISRPNMKPGYYD
jgi:chorismate mutase/prephenate dehydratase